MVEPAYLNDASNMRGGWADALMRPTSVDDVRTVLQEADRTSTPVTIAGAGTGLTGARIPNGGTVLSMELMREVCQIEPEADRAVVQPGLILDRFHALLAEQQRLYPPDPTERGGQLGGNVATNASGARTFKYGPTREWIERLEVVLADGDLLQLPRGRFMAEGYELQVRTESGRTISVPIPTYQMPAVRKHAAGYFARPDMDAIDLFIGSEGTLGVVTEIECRLVELPRTIFSAVIFFDSVEGMLNFSDEIRSTSLSARRAKNESNDGQPDASYPEATSWIDARAIEFIDAASLAFVRHLHASIPENASGGAIWIEQELTGEDDEVLGNWERLIRKHSPLADESWYALDERSADRMRQFRHSVPSTAYEFISRHGTPKFGTDMAVPVDRFREMFDFYQNGLAASGLQNVTWGHIGDCHLHVNILPRDESEVEQARELYRSFIQEALKLGGTVSAEHGIGKMKREYLRQMFGERGIEEMRNVKKAFDPNGILSPGNMFE